MKLNELQYAIVDQDDTVLGDGECQTVGFNSREWAEDEQKHLKARFKTDQWNNSRVVPCKLVPIDDPETTRRAFEDALKK